MTAPKVKAGRRPKAHKPAPPPPRTRRKPEEARALILSACQRLLAKDGPDAVGLKDVAAAAGVSHALVTHYFGSIDALLHAALEDYSVQQRRAALAQIMGEADLSPRQWMRQFFDWASRPETARMLAFGFLKGLVSSKDFFSRKHRGAARVVDAVLARSEASGGPRLERADIELMVLVVLSATHGYALGREGYWPSLGVDAAGSPEDDRFFEGLADMVELYLMARARPR